MCFFTFLPLCFSPTPLLSTPLSLAHAHSAVLLSLSLSAIPFHCSLEQPPFRIKREREREREGGRNERMNRVVSVFVVFALCVAVFGALPTAASRRGDPAGFVSRRVERSKAAKEAAPGSDEEDATTARLRSWSLHDTLPGVETLFGLDATTTTPPVHEAGYFRLNRTESAEMFYFYFQNRAARADAPVVLWMTGGPGCSSELALFYENGPYHINDDLSLSSNPYGWDTISDLIYVDQPINTGFSYSNSTADEVHSEKLVGEDMLDFIQELVTKHTNLQGKPFFVTGESYGGHYVPAVSNRIFTAIQSGEVSKSIINLQGFAVGNGLTEPAIQYGGYADFLYENKLISEESKDAIDNHAYPRCKFLIERCKATTKAMCIAALEECQLTVVSKLSKEANIGVNGLNVYDIRKKCEYPPLCYDFSLLGKYINQPSVRAALGVGDREWSSCSARVYKDMVGDWMVNIEPLIPPMLENGVRALIYAGDKDFICNWVGNRRWTLAMPWSGADAYNKAQNQAFVVDGANAGQFIASGNLAFLQIYEAGHMVPKDQPAVALTMLQRFLDGGDL